jgi:hypothetical protein
MKFISHGYQPAVLEVTTQSIYAVQANSIRFHPEYDTIQCITPKVMKRCFLNEKSILTLVVKTSLLVSSIVT